MRKCLDCGLAKPRMWSFTQCETCRRIEVPFRHLQWAYRPSELKWFSVRGPFRFEIVEGSYGCTLTEWRRRRRIGHEYISFRECPNYVNAAKARANETIRVSGF